MNFAHLVDLEWQLAEDESGLQGGRSRTEDQRLGPGLLASLGLSAESARRDLDSDVTLRRRLAVAWIERLRQENDALPGVGLDRAYRLVGAGLALAGLLIGIGAAKAILSYDGHEPVNVFHFVAVFFGLQILLVFLMLTAMGCRRLFGTWHVPGFLPRLVRSLSRTRWLRRFASLPASDDGSSRDRAFESLRTRRALYGDVERWHLFTLAQRFGIWFNVGALVTCLALVWFTDLAFSWSTTLDLSPADVHQGFTYLSAPWRTLVPEAAPSEEVVLASRWVRHGGGHFETGLSLAEALPLARRWWRFLVSGLVVWGLIPRLLLWILGTWRGRRAMGAVMLDHVGFQRLFDRLAPPIVAREIPESKRAATLSTDRNRVSETAGTGKAPTTPGSRPRVRPRPPEARDLPKQDRPETAPDRALSREPSASALSPAKRDEGLSGAPIEARPAKVAAAILWGRLATLRPGLEAALRTHASKPSQVIGLAGQADYEADVDSLKAAKTAQPARIDVLIEAGVQPTKDILAFLQSLRRELPENAMIRTVLLAASSGTFKAAEDDELEQWRRVASKLRDPYLDVVAYSEAT